MDKEQLKKMTYKYVEERVQKGTDKFNSLVIFPVLHKKLSEDFAKELCDMFRQVVYDTCILHPDWDEKDLLQAVSNQFVPNDK